ncbi:MAG: hypothetical protein JOZ24_13575 [Candidatus Eremiobacteraeota bacterium]|nr:hypothetical protein [Candidatus Eremiobacteraeota bacterium]
MTGPEKIMLIRHGEKAVPEVPNVHGIDEDGNDDDHSLIVRGWQRAGALVAFFAAPTRPGIAVPTTIFAAAPDPDQVQGDEGQSRRPVQTVTPLRTKLGAAAAWVTHPVNDLDALVADIRTRSGCVLVSWEHKRIPLIAAAFVSGPPQWQDVFDQVWLLDRTADAYRLTIVNQDLLAGDGAA